MDAGREREGEGCVEDCGIGGVGRMVRRSVSCAGRLRWLLGGPTLCFWLLTAKTVPGDRQSRGCGGGAAPGWAEQ